MKEAVSLIEGVDSKLDKVFGLHQQVKAENRQVKKENEGLKQELEAAKKEIEALQEKNKIIKLSKSFKDNKENTTDLKLKINELVREVDKCIAMLNK